MPNRLHIPAKLDGSVWRYGNSASANKRHTHAELEFNLITRGGGVYLLGNRRYEIRRGDLLWLFPTQEHVLIEQTPDIQMWIAVFKHRAIRRTARDGFARVLLQPHPDGVTCRRLIPQDLQRLESLLMELVTADGQPDLLNAGLGYVLLKAWQCFRNAAEVPVSDVHPAVERAARLIRDNSHEISLAEIARRAGLSSTRLSRLFKQQTGFPMVDFRNQQRIDRFLGIYGTGQRHTMLDAALEAGFGSYPQFHRIFSRVMGCSPRVYKSQIT